jgi:hypothetical protein
VEFYGKMTVSNQGVAEDLVQGKFIISAFLL